MCFPGPLVESIRQGRAPKEAFGGRTATSKRRHRPDPTSPAVDWNDCDSPAQSVELGKVAACHGLIGQTRQVYVGAGREKSQYLVRANSVTAIRWIRDAVCQKQYLHNYAALMRIGTWTKANSCLQKRPGSHLLLSNSGEQQARPRAATMINAITIDVEEYFHVHAFDGVIDRRNWDAFPSRVVESTHCILRLLREFTTQGTFFVLGCVAERHPKLIRDIAEDGHELATHGYGHQSVHQLTPEDFRSDVERSLAAIHEAYPAANVQGYRAPSFSITEDTSWAFDTLAAMGLLYDSSVFPIRMHDRYGIHSAPRFAHAVSSGLVEIPLSTVRAFGHNWPVAGGGYFRLAPIWLTKWGIQRINREGQPAVVYLHPWEFDPQQPRISGAPLKSKFRHYVNLKHTEDRLRRLLQQFSFGPIATVFSQHLSTKASATSGV